jgi:hypothetical protein
MREIRAIVAGLVVVVVIAMAWALWQRPAKEFHKIRGYRVEIEKNEGGSRKQVRFTIPIVTVARIASFIPVDVNGRWDSNWADGEVTGRDILDAAKDSAPGKPGVIEKKGNRIEVMADGAALDISIKDDWGKTVRVRVPRTLVEGVSEGKGFSVRDVLKKLDELGPGDVVHVQDGENQVTITAEAK